MHAYISSMLFIFLLIGGKFSIRRIIILILVLMNLQKFPEDIECIVEPIQGRGGIFVSNIEAAQNPLTLKRLGIQAVITAIKGKNLDKVIPQHIEYMYIPAVDHESFDISYYFEQSNNFIDGERKRTNVLVHCMAGISRSVTLVMAYLIKSRDYCFDQAYNYVKSKRKIIHPNNSFISQLKIYQKTIKTGKRKQILGSRLQNQIQISDKQWKIKTEQKSRYSHEPTRSIARSQNQNQNQKQNLLYYYKSLKSSIRIIFKQKQNQNKNGNKNENKNENKS